MNAPTRKLVTYIVKAQQNKAKNTSGLTPAPDRPAIGINMAEYKW